MRDNLQRSTDSLDPLPQHGRLTVGDDQPVPLRKRQDICPGDNQLYSDKDVNIRLPRQEGTGRTGPECPTRSLGSGRQIKTSGRVA